MKNIKMVNISCKAIINKKGNAYPCKYKARSFDNSCDFCGIHYKSFLKIKEYSNCKIINDRTTCLNNQKEKSRNYQHHNENIINIQKNIRRFIVLRNIKYRGISVYNRNLANNTTDFLSLTPINQIPIKNYFSYQDKQIWAFDIVTFKELVNNDMNNPYNTLKIPDEVINLFHTLLKNVEHKESIKIEKPIIEDETIIIQQECVEIFQLMDNLKNYTKCKWFLDLNTAYLKELYKQMEDIWNYRLNLSDSDKLRYVKNGKLFEMSVTKYYKINNINRLRKILLYNFRKLVTEGVTESDRSTASQWILSGLTLVSIDARNTFPWLFQSANIY